MTRDQCIETLAQDMTESLDMDALIEFYYESTLVFLGALEDEALVTEYEEWFEPDAPIVLEEVKS